MDMRIFVVKDKASNKVVDTMGAHIFFSAPQAVRTILPFAVKQYPLRDLELYEVAKIDLDTALVKTKSPELIDWNVYKFPENKAESFSPLDLSPQKIEELSDAGKLASEE